MLFVSLTPLKSGLLYLLVDPEEEEEAEILELAQPVHRLG